MGDVPNVWGPATRAGRGAASGAAEVAAAVEIPVIAIGGIDGAGSGIRRASGIAVISAIYRTIPEATGRSVAHWTQLRCGGFDRAPQCQPVQPRSAAPVAACSMRSAAPVAACSICIAPCGGHFPTRSNSRGP